MMSDQPSQQRIEEVSLNAWPAIQQQLYDGWLLRFAQGFTRRANSITPLYPATLDPLLKIKRCETVYIEKNQTPMFRLTPAFPELEQILMARGYILRSPTDVLGLALTQTEPFPIQAVSLEEWTSHFYHLQGRISTLNVAHQKILSLISTPTLFAILSDENGQVVACGMGVLEQEYFGLFDVLAHPQKRRKGYGFRLISGMLHWATVRGATYAYLQVEASNRPAQKLYSKLNFRKIYPYWYRDFAGGT